MSDPTPPGPSPLARAEVAIEDALRDVRIVPCPGCGGTGKVVLDVFCPDCGHSGLTTARGDG